MPNRKDDPDLRALLIEIISHRSSPLELIACAGEMIAADARFTDWFLATVKKRAAYDPNWGIPREREDDYVLTVSMCEDYLYKGCRDPGSRL